MGKYSPQCGHLTFHGCPSASIFQLYIGTLALHAGQNPSDHTIHDRGSVAPNIADHSSSSDSFIHGSAARTALSRISAAQGYFAAFARALATSSGGMNTPAFFAGISTAITASGSIATTAVINPVLHVNISSSCPPQAK